jgi:hypothetical protein
MKIGIMMSTAHRSPKRSPTLPMIGRTMSPGRTHKAPMENPVARARAGMASDSAA